MMIIKVDLLQWSINFFGKKTSNRAIKNENMSSKNQQKNYTNQLLKSVRNEN